MKFCFEDYTHDDHVMFCETQEELDLFSEILEKDGRRWSLGRKYTEFKMSAPCGFFFNVGEYSGNPGYVSKYKMLVFSDFSFGDKTNADEPEFSLEEYTDNRYTMICETKEEVDSFLEFLHNHGRTWEDGGSYIDRPIHAAPITIFFNIGNYLDFELADDHFPKLRWSDFQYKEKLYGDKYENVEDAILFLMNRQ